MFFVINVAYILLFFTYSKLFGTKRLNNQLGQIQSFILLLLPSPTVFFFSSFCLPRQFDKSENAYTYKY